MFPEPIKRLNDFDSTKWYVHGDPPIGVKLADDADEIDLDLSLEKYSLAKDLLTKVLKSFVNDCCSAPHYFVGPASKYFVGKEVFGHAVSWAADR